MLSLGAPSAQPSARPTTRHRGPSDGAKRPRSCKHARSLSLSYALKHQQLVSARAAHIRACTHSLCIARMIARILTCIRPLARSRPVDPRPQLQLRLHPEGAGQGPSVRVRPSRQLQRARWRRAQLRPGRLPRGQVRGRGQPLPRVRDHPRPRRHARVGRLPRPGEVPPALLR